MDKISKWLADIEKAGAVLERKLKANPDLRDDLEEAIKISEWWADVEKTIEKIKAAIEEEKEK